MQPYPRLFSKSCRDRYSLFCKMRIHSKKFHMSNTSDSIMINVHFPCHNVCDCYQRFHLHFTGKLNIWNIMYRYRVVSSKLNIRAIYEIDDDITYKNKYQYKCKDTEVVKKK